MMQYSYSLQSHQGICPPNWHIPIDDEFKLLEGMSDSKYGVGHEIWEEVYYRGYDIGVNLKTTYGWENGGNGTDLLGFSALPAGYNNFGVGFKYILEYSFFSTASVRQPDAAWGRALNYFELRTCRSHLFFNDAISVRCIKD